MTPKEFESVMSYKAGLRKIRKVERNKARIERNKARIETLKMWIAIFWAPKHEESFWFYIQNIIKHPANGKWSTPHVYRNPLFYAANMYGNIYSEGCMPKGYKHERLSHLLCSLMEHLSLIYWRCKGHLLKKTTTKQEGIK